MRKKNSVKSISIENFRGFEKAEAEFAIPDGKKIRFRFNYRIWD
jgi:hypothetical protein